jgi:Domain of unknown function (DUF4386)
MATSSPERSNGAGGRSLDPATRRSARIAGVWWLITFVTSIPALLLYDPLLNDHDYILTGSAETRIQVGAFLEVGLVISGIATAVVMYPVLKRQSQSIALGYVGCRIVESCMIAVGIVSVLSVLTLREDLAGAAGTDAATLGTVGRSLVAVHDATFLLGPAFCAGVGNGVLLGYLMFRSGLVPRRMAMIGLVGGPLALVTATAVLFGAWEQTSLAGFLFTLPEAVWELSLGIYLIVKGYKSSAPLLTERRRTETESEDAFSPLVAAP